jgi:hypothetical protein
MRATVQQVPRVLRRFDDSSGITWRISNAIRRISLRRATRFMACYLCPPHYERPVFVLGAPRSGTTMLFHLLRESSALGALPHEGHDLWRMFHHPRLQGWRSDAVRRGEVRRGERRYVNAYLGSHFTAKRFVEKTPENCLRIPYLLELFPDACFVVIRRNPCDVINSLINGWRHPEGRFRSYYVPENLRIPDYPHRHRWCFALIEGWRDHVASSVPQIAFAQWEHCTRAIHQGRNLVPGSRWTEVYFEHLLARPDQVASHIYEAIQIPDEELLRRKLAALLAQPVNALSPPGEDKWRHENESEIGALLPQIAMNAVGAGYRIDAVTGRCEIGP